MTTGKMARLMHYLHSIDAPQGHIYSTSAGELKFSFNSQLERDTHNYLLKRGFVYFPPEGVYIYRPRI